MAKTLTMSFIHLFVHFRHNKNTYIEYVIFINGIDLFCIDLLIFVMQSSDLLQDAKREKKVL